MKQLWLAAILSFSFLTGFAQVKIGIKAGGMFTNLTSGGIGLNTSDIYADPKLSYSLGGVAMLPVYSNGYLRAELLFSNKGYESPYISTVHGNINGNFLYVSVPILLQHQITNRLGVMAGPEIGYLLDAYQKFDKFGRVPITQEYKSLEVGVNLGVQYGLLEKLSIELRYNLGVTDITEPILVTTEDGPTVFDNDVFHRSLQLSLLYWLR